MQRCILCFQRLDRTAVQRNWKFAQKIVRNIELFQLHELSARRTALHVLACGLCDAWARWNALLNAPSSLGSS